MWCIYRFICARADLKWWTYIHVVFIVTFYVSIIPSTISDSISQSLRKYHLDTEELDELGPEMLLELEKDLAADEPQPLPATIPQIQRPEEVTDDKPCLAYKSCLLTLAKARIDPICPLCKSEDEVTSSEMGTAVILSWISSKHYLFMQGLGATMH